MEESADSDGCLGWHVQHRADAWPAGTYDIDTTTVSVAGNTAKGVVCRIYRDSVAQLNQQDSTKSGDGDTSNTVYHLAGSDVLIAVWSGATAGATAGIRIAGLYTPEA